MWHGFGRDFSENQSKNAPSQNLEQFLLAVGLIYQLVFRQTLHHDLTHLK